MRLQAIPDGLVVNLLEDFGHGDGPNAKAPSLFVAATTLANIEILALVGRGHDEQARQAEGGATGDRGGVLEHLLRQAGDAVVLSRHQLEQHLNDHSAWARAGDTDVELAHREAILASHEQLRRERDELRASYVNMRALKDQYAERLERQEAELQRSSAFGFKAVMRAEQAEKRAEELQTRGLNPGAQLDAQVAKHGEGAG